MICKKEQGFTLIEILVVAIIISVVTSIAMLSFDLNTDNTLKQEAMRFQALSALAAQEALLQNKEIAIEISDDKYEFLTYQEKKWVPLEDEILRPRPLPEDVEMQLQLEGEVVDFLKADIKKARIFLLSSGEITPFTVTLRQDSKLAPYTITGTMNGKIELQQPSDIDTL